MKTICLIALAAALTACGGPELTREQLDVRSIADGSECVLIGSHYLESRPQYIQDYVKRSVAIEGGDSYKIIHVGNDSAAGMQIAMVSYEAYKCH